MAIRERDGKKYYWNEITRQTSWSKPAGFKEVVTNTPSKGLKGIVPDTSAASLKDLVVNNKPTSLRGIVASSPKPNRGFKKEPSKSESDSDDSDSDDSDSTETEDSTDTPTKQSVSPVALTPPLSPISIENKNRQRTDSMRLLDVMEENENLRKMLEVKEQETQILRAELVSLRQDIERATGSQKHMQKTITEHEKTIARLRRRLASLSKSSDDDPPKLPAKNKSKAKQNLMSPIKGKTNASVSVDLAVKSGKRELSRGIASSESHSLSPRGRDLLNPRDLSRNNSFNRNPRDISRTRDNSRNPRDISVNLRRLRSSSDASASGSRSPRRLNSPQSIKPRVTQAQWSMQNKLGRSEKDYIDKLSSLVKILIRVKLSESKNQALQKKLLEELVGAHRKLYEDLRPMKQAKTQARFLDTLSGAFETHFLPLRKKYMEYALALDGAQNCCKEVGEAGPSLRRQRMEKLQELMDAPINHINNYCNLFESLQSDFSSSDNDPAVFRFLQLASTMSAMGLLMQQMVLKGQKLTLSLKIPALQSLRPRFDRQDLLMSGSMCTTVKRLIGSSKMLTGHLYLFESMMIQLIKTSKGLEATVYPMLPSVKSVASKEPECFGLETRMRYRLFGRNHSKYGRWQGRIIKLTEPAGRKDNVEITRWSHVRDTKLWMEQITTCLDANKMDEHLLEMLMNAVASNEIKNVAHLIEASSKAKTSKLARRSVRGINQQTATKKQTFSVVDMRNAKRHTPLMVATLSGHVEMTRLLMGYNADMSLTDNNGETALHLAADRGLLDHLHIMSDYATFWKQLARQNFDGLTPLDKLASLGSGELFYVLFHRLLSEASTPGEKDKINQHFNNTAKRISLKSPPQFGRKLEEHILEEVEGYEAPIPSLLVLLRDLWLEAGGAKIEGIFRVSPKVELSAQVKDLINRTTFAQREELTLEDRHLRDPHIFSRLLKHFFGDMKPGVLAPSEFMKGKKLRPIKETMASISPLRRAVLLFALDFLILPIVNTKATKMTPKSIGIVIGPNLAKFPNSDSSSILFENEMMSLFLEKALEWRMKQKKIEIPK